MLRPAREPRRVCFGEPGTPSQLSRGVAGLSARRPEPLGDQGQGSIGEKGPRRHLATV
jgi:hypothetical protein